MPDSIALKQATNMILLKINKITSAKGNEKNCRLRKRRNESGEQNRVIQVCGAATVTKRDEAPD